MKAKTTNITLDFPVQLADRQLATLNMRRPTLADLMDHPIGGDRDIAGEAELLAALVGLNREDLRQLDYADYQKLQVQLMRFQTATKPQRVPESGGGPVAADGMEP